MTGYGLTGPMTARGTTFDPKLEAEVVPQTGSRYRYGYRLTWQAVWLLLLWGTL